MAAFQMVGGASHQMGVLGSLEQHEMQPDVTQGVLHHVSRQGGREGGTFDQKRAV